MRRWARTRWAELVASERHDRELVAGAMRLAWARTRASVSLGREAGVLLTGCVGVLALREFGSSPAAVRDQVIVVVAAGAAAAVVFPMLVFSWGFITAAPQLAAERERAVAAELERAADSQREAEEQARLVRAELERGAAKLAIIAERALLAQELMPLPAQLQRHMQASVWVRAGSPIPGISEEERRAELESVERKRAEQVQVAAVRVQEALDRAAALIRKRGARLGVEEFADRLMVIDVTNPPTNQQVMQDQLAQATKALTDLVQHLQAGGVHPLGQPSDDDVVRFMREEDA